MTEGLLRKPSTGWPSALTSSNCFSLSFRSFSFLSFLSSSSPILYLPSFPVYQSLVAVVLILLYIPLP
ncbi:hypothetical protein BDV29DRAFT_102868 [Aspergillus leporis]|uniref:Uncharacterized protein n=1 Tax=Aspergillus leporis TaxID=41062 RepID=A0A5N5WFW9_9EURO|nr:hypothetical protein BDV29DRAFT_102868 [Aspergillus leporis]